MQANTDTLISGSFALQVVAEVFYDTDLDLYVPRTFLVPMVIYLMQEGYRYRASEDGPLTIQEALLDITEDSGEYDEYVIKTVLDFIKLKEDKELKVQIVLPGRDLSPFDVVMSFHGSECTCTK